MAVMNQCENCGAPLTPFPEQGYLLCEYCHTYYFPQPDEDGIRLLGEDVEGHRCPVCRQEVLQLASLDEMPGLYCRRCRGLLMEQASFGQVVMQRRGQAQGPGVPPPPLDRSQLQRRIHCPLCGRGMETYPYGGPGNIVVDSCARCQVIWLDTGELRRVIQAPGSDRGAGLKLEWIKHREDSWLAKALRQQGKLKPPP